MSDSLDNENHAVATEERPTEVAPKPAPLPPRRSNLDEEEEEGGFFVRHRLGLIVGVIAVGGGVWFYLYPSSKIEPARKAPEPRVISIQLPPPPPPPPPPAPKLPPPPPKNDKRVEQTPLAKPEQKPEAAKPKPADKPPEGLGTNNKGPGPGMAGLGSSGNGMLGGTGSGPGGGGSMSRWYAGQVGTKVAETLRTNRRTRSASMRIMARVWVDQRGKVTRGELTSSTGDSALDAALTNEVLPGIQLSEPPPAGMPMPIPLRLTARQPN
jgi:protein TonB